MTYVQDYINEIILKYKRQQLKDRIKQIKEEKQQEINKKLSDQNEL